MKLAAVLLSLGISGLGFTAQADRLDPLPADPRPVRYELQLTPNEDGASFDARIGLVFDVTRPIQRVVLNSAGLQITAACLEDGRAAVIVPDAASERVAFEFESPLAVGRHRMLVLYKGTIEPASGLLRFADRRDTWHGQLYSALCCAGRARRLAPLWDQPDLKASFDLELIVPEGVDAISAMPVEARVPLPGGKVRLEFEPTPPMTTELFFLSIGKFERLEDRSAKTSISIVLPRGNTRQPRYALAATKEVLGHLESYFGLPYPLPKLDSAVLPAVMGGAVANWGAIQYAKPFLTVDPAWSSQDELRASYALIVHEVSHQWFGNLVTPVHRGHGWLTEGLAVWIENEIPGLTHSDWQMWARATEYQQIAMHLDARAVAHPIVRSAQDMAAGKPAFNPIVYDKSGKVIRMLQDYAGPEAFQRGVRTYLTTHAYGGATSDDFWRALESASSLPLAGIGKDFTEQSGVPLIDVVGTQCAGGSTTLTLRQTRFAMDAASRQPRNWRVPVSAIVVGQTQKAFNIVSGERPATLKLAGCGAVKLNVGDTGYYRTRYDDVSFAAIRSAFTTLPASDQLGLLDDQYALAASGYVPFASYFDLVDSLSARSDPVVILQWVRAAKTLDRYYTDTAARAKYRARTLAAFGKLIQAIGWERSSGDSANTPLLRAALIELMAYLGDPSVREEASRRFEAAQGDIERLPLELKEPIVKAVGAGVRAGPVATALMRNAAASEDPRDARRYWLALAGAQDRATAEYVLRELLAAQVISDDLLSELLGTVAAVHAETTYDLVESERKALSARFGERGYFALLIRIAANSADPQIAERLSKAVAGRDDVVPESVERSLSEIHYRSSVRELRLSQVGAWIESGPR